MIYPIRLPTLSVREIAEHWSRESAPAPTSDEVKTEIWQAWLREEIIIESKLTPRNLLEIFIKRGAVRIDTEGNLSDHYSEEQPDGGVIINFLAPALLVPSTSPSTWSDNEMKDACYQLAEKWHQLADKDIYLIAPGLLSMTVAYGALSEFCVHQGKEMPKFWQSPIVAPKKGAKRKTPEYNAARFREFSAIVSAATRQWPNAKKRPSLTVMAEKLRKLHPETIGKWEVETVRQILCGTYSPMVKLGVKGV